MFLSFFPYWTSKIHPFILNFVVLYVQIHKLMSRNTPANRQVVKDKLAKKKQKEQEAAVKRKALLKEIKQQVDAKKA